MLIVLVIAFFSVIVSGGNARVVAVGSNGANSGVIYHDGVSWNQGSLDVTTSQLSKARSSNNTVFPWALCSDLGSLYTSQDGVTWSFLAAPNVVGSITSCTSLDVGLVFAGSSRRVGIASFMKSSTGSLTLVSAHSPGSYTFGTLIVSDQTFVPTVAYSIVYHSASLRWFGLVSESEPSPNQYVVTWGSANWGNATTELVLSNSFAGGPARNGYPSFWIANSSPILHFLGLYTYPFGRTNNVFDRVTCGTSLYEAPAQLCVGGLFFNSSQSGIKCSTGQQVSLPVSPSVCAYDYTTGQLVFVMNLMGTGSIYRAKRESDSQFDDYEKLVDQTILDNVVWVEVPPTILPPTQLSGPTVWSDTVVNVAGSSTFVNQSLSCLLDWIVLGTVNVARGSGAIISVNRTLEIRANWTQYASSPLWYARRIVFGSKANVSLTIDVLPSSVQLPPSGTNGNVSFTLPIGTYESGNFLVFSGFVVVDVALPSTRAQTVTCTVSAAGPGVASPSQGTLSVVVTLQQVCSPTDSGGLSTGALIGIIVGSVVGALAIAAIIIGVIWHKRKTESQLNAVMSKIGGQNE